MRKPDAKRNYRRGGYYLRALVMQALYETKFDVPTLARMTGIIGSKLRNIIRGDVFVYLSYAEQFLIEQYVSDEHYNRIQRMK